MNKNLKSQNNLGYFLFAAALFFSCIYFFRVPLAVSKRVTVILLFACSASIVLIICTRGKELSFKQPAIWKISILLAWMMVFPSVFQTGNPPYSYFLADASREIESRLLLSKAIAMISITTATAIPLFILGKIKTEPAKQRDLFLSVIVPLFSVLLVMIFFYLNSPAYRTPNIDAYAYSYYGREITRGAVLYRDLADNKGPVLHYLNALGQALGVDMWGIWLIELVFISLGVMLISRFMRQKAMLLLPFALMFFLRGFMRRFEGGNLTEEYAVLFFLVIFLLFWQYVKKQDNHRTLMLAGFVSGLSMLLRGNLISPLIALISFLTVETFIDKKVRIGFGRIFLVLAGFLIPFVFFILLFAAQGALFDFFDQAFFYNFFYSQKSGQALISSIGWLFRGYTAHMFIAVLCWLVTLYGCVVDNAILSTAERKLAAFIVLGYTFELLLFNLSGRNFPHYALTLLPYEFFLLYFTWLVMKAKIRDFGFGSIHTGIGAALVSGLLVLQAFGQIYTHRNMQLAKDTGIYEELSEHLQPGQKLVMWGYRVDFHYILDVPSPSRFYYQHPFMTCAYITTNMIEEFVHSIEAEKPLIVDTKGMGQAYLLNLSERNNTKSCEALGLFFEYFEKNYRFAGNLSNNFAVYFPYAD